MKKQLTLAFTGTGISFFGAIPLGAINITAFEISVSKSVVEALYFSGGVLIVEVFFVWLTLKYDYLVKLNNKYVKPLLLVCILVLTGLAINSFVSSTNSSLNNLKTDSYSEFYGFSFLFGMLLSAINPLQFPYWITWNKTLISKGILLNLPKQRIPYLIGIGLGTFLALLLFISFGQYIIEYYQKHQYISKVILGILYICLALYFTVKLLKKKKDFF